MEDTEELKGARRGRGRPEVKEEAEERAQVDMDGELRVDLREDVGSVEDRTMRISAPRA